MAGGTGSEGARRERTKRLALAFFLWAFGLAMLIWLAVLAAR